MSIQGALTSPSEPQSQPQRRQNSSCDSCRRSKRRCFFLPQTPGGTNASCAHCTRLGNLCTFDFASSRLGSRPKKRQRQIISTPGQTSVLSAQLPLEDLPEIPTNSSEDASVFTSADDQDDFAAWLNFDIDNYLATDQHSSTAAEPTLRGPGQTSNEQDDRRLSLVPTGSRTVYRFPYDKECVPGSSFRSPVHLLNSKLDTRILDERLLSIYETILTGSATRFLDYDTNPYATRIRYRIERNCQESIYRPAGTISLPKSAMISPASGHVETSSPSSSSTTPGQSQTGRKRSFSRDEAHEEGYNMTVVGCARFLDHFGDIYGNRLSQSTKRKSDTALKAALRLFALQWLPIATSEPGVDHQTPSDNTSIAMFHDKTSSRSLPSEFYTDAWYQARMAINETKAVRSFRAVFAIFIFDGTAIPMSARSDSRINNIEHEFLNMGLEKLHQLDGLVQNYCTTLGPLSQYSALAEASLAVVRWSGYIRDTGAALTSDHQCRLPGPLRGAHSKLKLD